MPTLRVDCKAVAILALLLSLSSCVHAQTLKVGGQATVGGQLGVNTAGAATPPQLQIVTSSCPSGTCSGGQLNQPFTLTLPIQNGFSPYTCSLNSGSLPNGTTLSTVGSTCVVGGAFSPNAGAFTFNIKVVDSASTPNQALTGNLTVNVSCASFGITSAPTLPLAIQGSVYDFILQTVGGTPPISCSITGSLPPGITQQGAGSCEIKGTPTLAGQYPFPFNAQDACNLGPQTSSINASIQVNSNLVVNTSTLNQGFVNSPYGPQSLSASGGTAPYLWVLTSGSLPPGIVINGANIQGTPTRPGVFPFRVTVQDSIGSTAFADLTLTINCTPLAITSPLFPNTVATCTQGQSCTFQMTASGGFSPLNWSGPGLAACGLNINSTTGQATGTATCSGIFNPTVSVSDTCPVSPQTQSAQIAIAVNQNSGPLTVSPTTLNQPIDGTAFSQSLPISGGVPPYTVTLLSGTFPPGITLSTGSTASGGGVVSGNATTATTTTPQVQIVDSNTIPTTITPTLSITSVCPVVALSPVTGSALPPQTQNSAYSTLITATSPGYSPLNPWAASGLPTGDSINPATGQISGTTSQTGAFSVAVTYTDNCSPTPTVVTYNYTLQVIAQLTLQPTTFQNGTNGTPYAQSATAIGGVGPYLFSVTSGTVPTGTSFSQSGATDTLAGTPSVAGTFNFTLQVSDSASHTATQAYTVVIAGSGNATCGATQNGAAATNNKACGNYAGAPYEELSTTSPNTAPNPIAPGTLHLISACTLINNPVAGDVWRFASDISDGVNGTNPSCIHFAGQGANNWVLDMAGHALTGGMLFDQSKGGAGVSGISVVNGTITCNVPGNGCIRVNNGNGLTKSFLVSHITSHNQNSPANPVNGVANGPIAMQIEADGSTSPTCTAGSNQKTFNGACIEIAHVDTALAVGYTGTPYTTGWSQRSTNIIITGAGGVIAEVWNTRTVCGGFVDACQGIVFFNIGAGSNAHNNLANWTTYQGSSDNGRAFLADSAGKKFNTSCKSFFNNDILIFNNRALRTRQEGCVSFSNNLIEHLQGGSTIMMGANDDYSEKINNVVSNNTFLMEGGTGALIQGAYGPVFDSNTYTCVSNCSTSVIAKTDVQNLTFAISSATRTAGCVVTMTLPAPPSSTSSLAGLFVNVSGTSSSFDVAGTAGNVLTSHSGTTFTYTQAGCSGAASIGAGGVFWMAQSSVDNFAASGAQVYFKNNVIDPLLTNPNLLVACGQQGHPNNCLSGLNPQFTLNGGQTQIKACNNSNGSPVSAVGGTGALVQNLTGTCP